jgi:hypothetical protein
LLIGSSEGLECGFAKIVCGGLFAAVPVCRGLAAVGPGGVVADWDVLGLASDPVPGDPSAVAGLATRLGGYADLAATNVQRLREISSAVDGGALRARGDYVFCYVEVFRELPVLLDGLGKAYRQCSDALRVYAEALHEARMKSRNALQRGGDGFDRYTGARRQADALMPVGKTLPWHSLPVGVPGLPFPITPVEVDTATTGMDEAVRGQVRAAVTRACAAVADQWSARTLADEAVTARDQAADRCAKEINAALDDSGIANKSWWERTEPVRNWIGGILSPFGIVTADHWIDWLAKVAGEPSKWVKGVDGLMAQLDRLEAGGQALTEALISAGQAMESVGGRLDAWGAFSPTWLQTAARNIGSIRGLSNTLGGLGLVADVSTIISPDDSGVLGGVDRVAAGANGVLITMNMCMDEIPVVGEVVMVGTGVYLAGDFLYHHWEPFKDACDEVGSATVTVAKDVGSAVSDGWNATTSFVGDLFG